MSQEVVLTPEQSLGARAMIGWSLRGTCDMLQGFSGNTCGF